MEMIFINNKPIQITNWDYTILQISEHVGISIPRFCYHEKLSIAGNCRMCMVEIKNISKPVIACATSITKDMYIFTNSELVKIARENVLELLLINHPLDCPIRDQGGECDPQDQSIIFGTDRGRFIESKRSVEDKELGPIVKTIMTRCIHCTRCVRYAEEVAGNPILGTMGRGKDMEIGTYVETSFDSEIIGNIVDLCPVGASTSKPYAFKARSWELQSSDCFDIFDSLGSFIRIDAKGNEVMRVLPRKNDLLNEEWITDKVRFFYEGASINRLLFPVINRSRLIHCSIEFAFNFYIYLYNKAKLNSFSSMVTILQDNLDLTDILHYRIFNDSLGIYTYFNRAISKRMSSDLRKSWLLNKNIVSFSNTVHFLFMNVNLKYECSVLNAILFRSVFQHEFDVQHKRVYYIGNYFKNTFPIIHVGLTNNTSMNIQVGKSFLCFHLYLNDITFVDSSNFPMFNFSAEDYVNTFNIFSPSNISTSYIASTSGELNSLELGLCFDFPEEKNYSFLHLIGNDSVTFLPNSEIKIYSGHHLPEQLIFDLYLPTACFYEIPKHNISSLWLNNQLDLNSFSDKTINVPGEVYDNITIIKVLIDLAIGSSANFNVQFIKLIDLVCYISNKSGIHYFNNISFNESIVLQPQWNASIFYQSDSYSKNSKTLYSAYKNHLNHLLY
jgi:NADH dehydrogenase (ubiquinone) Fe-S protein 1